MLGEWLSYWDVALAAVGAVALLAAAGLALVGLAVWQRRARRRRLRVAVTNEGNTRSQYALWVDNPAGQLAFRLYLNGQAQDLTPAAAAAASEPRPAAGPALAQRAAGLTSALSGWLGELGRFLPGQLGAGLRGIDNSLRQTDYTARRLQTLTAEPLAAAARAPIEVRASEPARAHTPAIAPGAGLELQLEVTPAAGFNAPARSFRLLSQALEAEAEPARAETVQVAFRPVSVLIRWVLPAVILLGAVVGAGLCALYVLSAFGFGL